MKKKVKLFVTALLFIPALGFSQVDSLSRKLDSLHKVKDSTGVQLNDINPAAYNENTNLTFNSYFVLLASDIKQEFTKPLHMRGRDWINFGKFSAVLFATSFADKPVQKFAVRITKQSSALRSASHYITNFGASYETYTLAGIAAYGLIFKKSKMVTTTLLATQAYLAGSAMENTVKFLTGRTRPDYYKAANSKFLGPGFYTHAKDSNGVRRYASFPSGHTTVAFAAATVFASEYKDKPLIPIIAYTAATLVGMSRITENRHWTTDVIAGAALGFLQGKNVVNNYHRYAKIKVSEHIKNPISLNLQYINNQFVPELVYHFN